MVRRRASRPHRLATGLRPFSSRTAGDSDEEGGDDGDAGEGTSVDDLTQSADPQQFDRTFLAGDAQLTLDGRFDPVAGDKQVLPRVAYTINFNFVWNAEKGRWEPDEGNVGRGGLQLIEENSGSVSGGNIDVQGFSADVDPSDALLPVLKINNPSSIGADVEVYQRAGVNNSDDITYLYQITTNGTVNSVVRAGSSISTVEYTYQMYQAVSR